MLVTDVLDPYCGGNICKHLLYHHPLPLPPYPLLAQFAQEGKSLSLSLVRCMDNEWINRIYSAKL